MSARKTQATALPQLREPSAAKPKSCWMRASRAVGGLVTPHCSLRPGANFQKSAAGAGGQMSGRGAGGFLIGKTAMLAQEALARGGDRDQRALPIDRLAHHEAAIDRILPDGQPRARGAPCVEHIRI